MKSAYDLIVVGAGPAGLTAAKIAAENGLSVALLERKNSVEEILRMCGMMIVSLSGSYMGERVVLNEEAGLLCFPNNGFSVKYDGPTKDFYTWQMYSPNGEMFSFGDYAANLAKGKAGRASAVYDKSWFLAGLALRNAKSSAFRSLPVKTLSMCAKRLKALKCRPQAANISAAHLPLPQTAAIPASPASWA